MLRFAVHDDPGLPGNFELINAHLIGPEETVMRGKIRLCDGIIECEKRGSRSVALALLYEAGDMGRVMLQTCLLPERDEPYSLAVELARQRIKTFITKSEEWQMFDLSAEHPAMKQWEHARGRLTEALSTSDQAEASKHAREAIQYAIDAVERLALAHAEILLHRRFAAKAASSATLGVRVHPGRNGQSIRDIIARDFDVLVMPLVWRDLEVEEGRYEWGAVDAWMDWAKRQGKPVMAGPLLDFSKSALPDWMHVWQHDYDTLRDLTYDHVERVVQRYHGVVSMWSLCSGLNINEDFEFTAEQMIDLVRMARLLAKQYRRGARTMIEIAQPFGEYAARNRDAMPPLTFVERLLQEGVGVDAIGVRLLLGGGGHGQYARDLMDFSNVLDRYVYLEKPVLISALGVPSRVSDPARGYWQETWSPEVQARWISRAFGMAMSKPFVESIFWNDLFDHDSMALPFGGLIDEAGRSKPVMSRLVGMRKRLRKPLGRLKLPSRMSTGEPAK